MDKFIAVDVETANECPSSICAIGAVKVDNGLVTDSRYELVKPEPEYYKWFCTRVHGLNDEDTCTARTFDRVWQSWQQWMAGYRLVAHNAAFDRKCISAACRTYRLDEPEEFLDTLTAARRQIPRGMLDSKSLDSLCDFFGIPLEQHHCALDDALACARLAIILL